MKKTSFSTPEVDFIYLDSDDIITASTGNSEVNPGGSSGNGNNNSNNPFSPS